MAYKCIHTAVGLELMTQVEAAGRGFDNRLKPRFGGVCFEDEYP